MRAPTASGFTYVGLIILVAMIGLVGAASLKVNALLERAEAERQLLDIGAAFADALQSYAGATPRGQPQQPPSLQELLRDPRFPNPRRHLRKVFVDPITGKAEWGIMYAAQNAGVIGVYSLSKAKPFKVANFDARFQNFEGRDHLSDWKFTLNGQGALSPEAAAASAGEAARIEAEKLAAAAPSLFARPAGARPTDTSSQTPPTLQRRAAPGDSAAIATAAPTDTAPAESRPTEAEPAESSWAPAEEKTEP
jgi:type II secretory pathway pseudopilin PulG